MSAPPAAEARSVALSISIKGKHFVNGSGHVIRLLGVNHTSAEYGCVDGFGYDDGHFTNADAAAIASWGANAVRVPLNEDCWLGINGQPNSNQGADPPLTQAGYQREIKNYVAALHAHGLYAILDLHWTAPGGQVALEQQPMPDWDHSPDFWTSVAGAFKSDRAVTGTYRIAGLQTLLDAVRATGARQPVMTDGLDFANDLGDTDHARRG